MKLNFSRTRLWPGRYISICNHMISYGWNNKDNVKDTLCPDVFTDTPTTDVSDLWSCRRTLQTTKTELSQVLNANCLSFHFFLIRNHWCMINETLCH